MECSCGKLISRHMHGKCFACRYEEMKVAKIKVPVKCKFCGKEFISDRGLVTAAQTAVTSGIRLRRG